MIMTHIKRIGGCAAIVLCAFFFTRWLLAEPTISVHFDNAPLSKVIEAFQKQGKIKIRSTLDPATPVTVHLKRSPVLEAIDILAVRVDGNWRVGYFVAPDAPTLAEGLASPEPRPQGWLTIFYPAPMLTENPIDPRKLRWNVEKMSETSLHDYLNQGAQKLPVEFFVKAEWNPTIAQVPSSGTPRKVVAEFAKSVRGKSAEVFILSRGSGDFERGSVWFGTGGNWERDSKAQSSQQREPATTLESNRRGPNEANHAPSNQQWMRERMESMLAAMPAEEREIAKKFYDEMRAIRESTQGLDEAARREAFREFFSRPEIQERFEQVMASRDAKRTPEQREARYRRIAERRLEARKESGNPLRAGK
jgi:hypothetical protein